MNLHVVYCYDLRLPSVLAAPLQILHTAHALAEAGAQVTVVVREIAAPATSILADYGLEPHPGLTFRELGSWRPVALRTVVADAGAPDSTVLVSRGEPGLALLAALDERTASPLIFEAHRLCFPQTPRPSLLRALPGIRGAVRDRNRRREIRLLARADGVLCLTRAVEADVRQTLGYRGPTAVLPSGTTVPDAPPTDDDARDIDVLYAGKLEARKGVETLVESMRYLGGRTLWIAGGDARQQRRLAAFAERLGVGARVRWFGQLRPADVRTLWSRARVGVCPLPRDAGPVAERYTSPLKVLEAMAHGAPLVVSDVPSIRELVDERHAVFAAPSDPRSLAEALRVQLSDRAAATRRARAALEVARAHAWPLRAARLRTFLEERLAAASGPAARHALA